MRRPGSKLKLFRTKNRKEKTLWLFRHSQTTYRPNKACRQTVSRFRRRKAWSDRKGYMRKRIYLNASDGYEPGSKCRREKVFGRLELLKAFFDGPPFWMIRLRNHTSEDHKLVGSGNGHWRFTDRASAEKRFAELCAIPEYVSDEENRLKTADRRREAVLKLRSTGKFKSSPGTECFQRECHEVTK